MIAAKLIMLRNSISFPLILILISLFLLYSSNIKATDVGGVIDSNVVWNATENPYNGDVQVGVDGSLTIESGVNFNGTIVVAGELKALGTDIDPITINGNISFTKTSVFASVEGKNYVSGSIIKNCIFKGSGLALDLNYASPYIVNNVFQNRTGGKGINGWTISGVYVYQSSPIIINNEFKNNYTVPLGMYKASPQILNNIFDGNNSYATYINNNYGGQAYINQNTFSNNSDGIYISGAFYGVPATITNNNLVNSGTEIYNSSNNGFNINATNNYWGTTDLNEIEDRIFHYFDDVSNGEIIFEPLSSSLIDISQTTINAPPIANAGMDQAIFNSITLDASQSFDQDGGSLLYSWELIHRTDSSNNFSTAGETPTIANLAAGFYDVTLTVEDENNAIDTDTMVFSATGTTHYSQEQLDQAIVDTIQLCKNDPASCEIIIPKIVYDSTITEQSDKSILTEGEVVIESGADVTFQACSIKLSSGFVVKPDGIFKAITQTCQ